MYKKQVIVLGPAAWQGGCPGQSGSISYWVYPIFKEQE